MDDETRDRHDWCQRPWMVFVRLTRSSLLRDAASPVALYLPRALIHELRTARATYTPAPHGLSINAIDPCRTEKRSVARFSAVEMCPRRSYVSARRAAVGAPSCDTHVQLRLKASPQHRAAQQGEDEREHAAKPHVGHAFEDATAQNGAAHDAKRPERDRKSTRL